MAGRLQGKSAVVTGASSGVGRAISLALAREGALLVCSDLRELPRPEACPDSDKSTHDLIVASGGKAIFVKTDVTNADQVEALVKTTVDHYGRLDIFVNNAGTTLESGLGPIWEKPNDIFEKTMKINGSSVFYGIKFATKQMIQQEPSELGCRGRIVSVSSILGLVGFQQANAYTASKHAVIGLTKSAALDAAPYNININAVCPGWMHTALVDHVLSNTEINNNISRLHPLGGGRTGKPEEIANAVVFLASEENSWMTGAALSVDGGYVAQ
ncbi:NAD(P)-binding protein [Rhizodiscina lignyota]|uniref:NAD(P)-binding protein n=1 Tax=Rhizodiscina lignyota TaxID=1504668 RepID=A0A9P4IHP9_9PEZI|nr:NAD(P)-binding protein [Rhizodiscina lignyota]